MKKRKIKNKEKEEKLDFEEDEEDREDEEEYHEDYLIYKGKPYILAEKVKDLKDVRLLRENVFQGKKKWYNPFSWFRKKIELKNNVVFLLDDEGKVKIMDGVKEGFFAIRKGEELYYYILNENKLRNLDFDLGEEKKPIRCWVLDINNPVPLPSNPEYDVSDVSNIITKAIAGNKKIENLGKGDLSWLKWVFIIVGGLLVLYMLVKNNVFGLGDLLGVTKAVGSVVQTNETITREIPGGVIRG